MKHRVVALIIVMASIFTVMPFSSTSVTAAAATDWKQVLLDQVKSMIVYDKRSDTHENHDGSWEGRYPLGLNGFLLADLNFDGIPELMVFGNEGGPHDTMRIFSISGNGTDMIYYGFGQDWGLPDSCCLSEINWDMSDFNWKLYCKSSDGSLAYVFVNWVYASVHFFGDIYITSKAAQMDSRFEASAKVASFSIDVWDEMDNVYTLNEREVSEAEYTRRTNELLLGYEKIDYTPAMLHYDWQSPANDKDVLDFLDSYVPETEFLNMKIPNKHSTWATEELEKAMEQNLIPNSLKGPSIDYTKSVTRSEFAGIAVKVFESFTGTATMPVTVNPFTDTKDADALKAYGAGIMVGVSDNKFDPNARLTREQAATALTRVFKGATIPGWTFETDSEGLLRFARPAPFADDSSISSWAKESVYFMASNKIILGTGNNMFAPRATTSAQEAAGYAIATREQALLMALRMVEGLEAETDLPYEIVVPLMYDWIKYLPEGLAVVHFGGWETGKYGFIDKTGKEVLACKYGDIGYDFVEETGYFVDGLMTVEIGGKWGFIDVTGREIVPCKYDAVRYIFPGMVAVMLGNSETGKWGAIDNTGKEVVPCKYVDVDYSFSEGMLAVRNGDWQTGKWGFVDKSGKEVVQLRYDDVKPFNGGFAAVRLGNKWGFVDKTGVEIVPIQFDSVMHFSEGAAPVSTGGKWANYYYEGSKWGLIDSNGQVIVTPKYDSIDTFSDGVARVSASGRLTNDEGYSHFVESKWGLIDTAGREIVAPKYDFIADISDGVMVVGIGGKYVSTEWGSRLDGSKYGLIDITGREILQCTYDGLFYLSEGLLAANSGGSGKYGVIDFTGKVVAPFIYDDIDPFDDGVAAVMVGDSRTGKWGFIDKTGREIVPPKYTLYDGFYYEDGYTGVNFTDGIAVLLDAETGKWGAVDKTGKEVVPFIYGWLTDFVDGMAAANMDGWYNYGNWGVIDKTGRVILPLQYDRVWLSADGMVVFSIGDKWGLISIKLI